MLIKIQLNAIVCGLLYFTAKSLHMFRVPTAPIIRSTKICNRTLRYRLQFLVLLIMGAVGTRNMWSDSAVK